MFDKDSFHSACDWYYEAHNANNPGRYSAVVHNFTGLREDAVNEAQKSEAHSDILDDNVFLAFDKVINLAQNKTHTTDFNIAVELISRAIEAVDALDQGEVNS